MNCRYKFYLRYIQKLAWPAQTTIDDLRFEEDRNAGIRFHQLLHQYFIGFNPELLIRMAENDPDSRVLVWFQTFLASPYAQLQGKLESEKTITTCVDDKTSSLNMTYYNLKVDNTRFTTGNHLTKSLIGKD